MTQMNLSIREKQTQTYRIDLRVKEEVRGGIDWEFGLSRCKLLYIGWINNKVLLFSTGYSISYDKP